MSVSDGGGVVAESLPTNSSTKCLKVSQIPVTNQLIFTVVTLILESSSNEAMSVEGSKLFTARFTNQIFCHVPVFVMRVIVDVLITCIRTS